MKKMLLIFLSIVSVLSASAQKAEKLAEDRLANRDFVRAQEIYDSLYQAEPDELQYLFFSGICDYELKQENSAIDKFNKVLSKIPDDAKDGDAAVQTAIYNARAHHNIYMFDQAIGIYDKLLSYKLKKKKRAEIEELKQNSLDAKELMKDFKQIMVTKLAILNSPYDDHTPIPADGGNLIFFTSKRPFGSNPPLSPEGKYYEDIMVWNKNRGLRSEPYNLGPPVNTADQDATAGASHDGTMLFIFRATEKNPGDLYVSIHEDSIWSVPKPFGKNINKKRSREQHATLSPDGNTLFFSSNYRKGKGDNDIWVSQKNEDGTWGKAENMEINTEKDDGAPFIMDDGKTLYFSSKGYKGMGGYDVFRTVKQEDGSWSEPENIGFPINTTGDDIFYFPANSENIAYFTRRSGGTSNIYKAQLYGDQEEYLIVEGLVKDDNFYTKSISVNKVASDTMFTDEGFYVKGFDKLIYPDSVMQLTFGDENIQQHVYFVPDENSISVYDVDNKDYLDVYQTNSDEGDYKFLITPGKRYKVVYESEGYLFDSKNITAPEYPNKNTIAYNAILTEIERGNTKKTKLTPFEANSRELNNFTSKELDIIAEYFEKYPQLYIDFSGNNSDLLAERQKEAEDYLVSKGVSKDRIFTNLSVDTVTEGYLQYTIFDDILLADLEENKSNILDSIANVTDNTINEPDEEEEILISIDNVFFAFDRSRLTGGDEIKKLGEYLKTNSNAKVLIIGYTDAVGSANYNQALSVRRAGYIKGLLTNAGADDNQVEVKGYGESNPVTLNKINGVFNEQSKKYNRRVEFKVMEQGKPKVRIIQMQNIPEQYKNPNYKADYSGK